MLTIAPAAATTASATATGSAAPSASATTTAAFAHWPGFVDYQRAAEEVLAIAALYNAFCFLVVTKLRKTESARISRELVANDLDGISVKTGPRKPIL